jgi:hypothetical protein
MSRLPILQVWMATVVLGTGLAVVPRLGARQHPNLYRKGQ